MSHSFRDVVVGHVTGAGGGWLLSSAGFWVPLVAISVSSEVVGMGSGVLSGKGGLSELARGEQNSSSRLGLLSPVLVIVLTA